MVRQGGEVLGMAVSRVGWALGMLSKPQSAWPRHGGGQVVLETPPIPLIQGSHIPALRAQSCPPPALGCRVQDSRGVFWRALPSLNTHVASGASLTSEQSPDLAGTPRHPGPAYLRPGLSLWTKATSLSRRTE